MGISISFDQGSTGTIYIQSSGVSAMQHCCHLLDHHRQMQSHPYSSKKGYPLLHTGYMIFFNTGIQTLTSATSSIIVALTPILTAIGCAKVYHEKIKTIGWITIATAFMGVLVLLLWDGVFSINIGLIWTMGAALVFFGYNMMSRFLSSKGYTALEIVTYSMIFGALLLGFWSVQGFQQLAASDMSHILALVYLGAFPSAAAYFLWGKAMSFANRTSEVTNFMFVTPLLSTILGFLILREVPNMGTFLGGAIIICSIIVFNLKGK